MDGTQGRAGQGTAGQGTVVQGTVRQASPWKWDRLAGYLSLIIDLIASVSP